MNRLIHEKSPYLLQHAHNPVDWYPWGKEAFDRAKEEDKPIFLSIGYSTCHWCHVMEKESFSHPEIAKSLNAAFINVKVDREELPGVDAIYMEFAQALMGSAGGWPLNLILTPELKPFFAVTYLPPVNKRGMIGIQQFIQHITHLWHSEDREKLLQQADQIVNTFAKMAEVTGVEIPSSKWVQGVSEVLFEMIDPVYGGMKGEPKFPMSYQLLFLLQHARVYGDARAMFCVEITLENMARGGIYDQLGGGFSRYAVDEGWRIPHFEKMLYDNALLASTYLQAWQFTQNPLYREVAIGTLQYMIERLRMDNGAFISAEDADLDGKEGRYYTWTLQELQEILPPDEARLMGLHYGIMTVGPLEGRNVLHVAIPSADLAEELKIPNEELEDILRGARLKLLQKRGERPAPLKDDKVICAWNGLAIDAFACSSLTLGEKEHGRIAVKAAEFLYEHLYQENRLKRRWREGETRFEGGLEDYAFLIKGLLSLFEAGLGTRWLQWAIDLSDLLTAEFKVLGGAFYNQLPDQHLLIRRCEFYDGAEPSGNAVHAENLIRLSRITGSSMYLNQAEDIFRMLSPYLEGYPPGGSYYLKALQRYYDVGAYTIVVALDAASSLEQEIREHLMRHFDPHLTLIWKRPQDQLLEMLIPSLVDKKSLDGQTAVYICQQDRCEAPLLKKEEIFQAIDRRK